MNKLSELKELLPFSKTLNVLFAEDNEDVREQIHKMLSNFFDNIDVALDGKEALDMYNNFYNKNQKHYDILISDLSMPNLDGISLTKEILKINKDQIILIISAYTHPDNLHELINLGITKFIQKPINHENILDSIYYVINLSLDGHKRFA